MFKDWIIRHYSYWGRPILQSWEIKATLGVLVLVLIWSLIWKGLALWKAAKNNSPVWFVALLLINTVGILEIAYIFWFSKIENKKEELK